MTKLVYQLDGLTCPSCLQKIEGALGQQAGVKTVTRSRLKLIQA